MIFVLRPINPMEFIEQMDEPVEVKADDYKLVVVRAKRQGTAITGIHVKPDDPSNSKVIVSSIVDETPGLVNVYLRNLDKINNTSVMISFVESP